MKFLHVNIHWHNPWKKTVSLLYNKKLSLEGMLFLLAHLKGIQLQYAKILVPNKIKIKLI